MKRVMVDNDFDEQRVCSQCVSKSEVQKKLEQKKEDRDTSIRENIPNAARTARISGSAEITK